MKKMKCIDAEIPEIRQSNLTFGLYVGTLKMESYIYINSGCL